MSSKTEIKLPVAFLKIDEEAIISQAYMFLKLKIKRIFARIFDDVVSQTRV